MDNNPAGAHSIKQISYWFVVRSEIHVIEVNLALRIVSVLSLF